MSLALLATVSPSMSASGRSAARSTLLQGNVPAKPFTQGVLAIAASGAPSGWPFPPGLWCSPSCARADQTTRLTAKRSVKTTSSFLLLICLTVRGRESDGRGGRHHIRSEPPAVAGGSVLRVKSPLSQTDPPATAGGSDFKSSGV